MKYAKLIDGKIKILNIEKPSLDTQNSKGAIIKVLGCGLCGSDLVKIKHGAKNIILGHEVVGIIDEINADCSFKKGDVVALGHHYPCFSCEFCKNESFSMCKTFKSSNIYPAGFSEYIFVNENHLKYTVCKMNESLKNDEKAFLEPLSCCIRAVRRAGFDYEKNNSSYDALVVGLGSIGLLMLKTLSAFKVGAWGIDISKERMDLAHKHGFSYEENKKYDVVFLTAGSSRAIQTALEKVIDGGKIIIFSSVETDNAGFSNNEIYYRELSIISSYSPAPKDIRLSGKLLNEKKVTVENLSTRYNLNDLQKAVDDSFENKIFKAFIEI